METKNMFMRKYVLFFALAFASVTVNAQFNTGQKMISGRLSVNSSTTTIPSSSGKQQNWGVGISPSYAWFRSAKSFDEVGIGYAYGHSKDEASSSVFSTINSHAVNLYFQRTNLETIARKLYFTYDYGVSAGFGTQKTTNFSPSSYSRQNSYGASIAGGIGIMYQLTPRFLFDAGLNNLFSASFSHSQISNSGTTTSKNNSFSLNTGLSGFTVGSLGFGVRYLL
jgi:hypothetical protein